MTDEGLSKITENYKMYRNYEKTTFENRVHVKKKSLVYLWSFMLLYITLGAVIIGQIERNQEVCENRNSRDTNTSSD